MAEVDTWQRPAPDDINPDALEYLFVSDTGRRTSAPWVDIIAEPEPIPRTTPDILRMQTKVEMLAAEVDLLSSKLQQANCQIGYLQAQLSKQNYLRKASSQMPLD